MPLTAMPIAITGIGCRFPGADSPDAFWQNLLAGRDAIAPIPPDRFPADAFNPDRRAGKIVARHAGTVADLDRFDRTLFSISANEARTMDPQQRLLLEVAWEALERSGRAPATLDGAAVGVFVGISSVDYWLLQARAGFPAGPNPYVSTGGSPGVAAGRIAHVLGLTGPALAVDTACSSALVATHLACASLARAECDIALAGAVNLILSPDVMASLTHLGVLAADGRTRAFDAAADGFVRGEGAAVVVLERRADAARSGRPVIAEILASATGHDGRTNGLVAPSRAGQARVIRAALHDAGITADQVGFVEAHGSGTPLSDAIEIAALAEVFRGRRRDRPLLVGSVKTNIGHLEAAAGIAGLVKAALAVERGVVPPTLHLADPARRIAWDTIPVAPALAATPWTDRRRVAGVSAFGFSGTNAHVVLASAEPARSRGHSRGVHRVSSQRGASAPVLVALTARTPGALLARARQLRETIAAAPDRLAAIGVATARAWTGLPVRHAFVCHDPASALRHIDALIAAPAPTSARGLIAPRVVFRFDASAAGAPRPATAPAADTGVLEDRLAEFVAVARAFVEAGVTPAAVLTEPGVAADAVARRLGLAVVAWAEPDDADIVLAFDGSVPARADGMLAIGSAIGGRPVLDAAAHLFNAGVDIDLGRFATAEPGDEPMLPTYPFERQRAWFDDA